MPSLSQLRIVITRPLPQGHILGKKIATLGGQFLLVPTIEIADASDQALLHTPIQQLDKHDIAIFISPNAVQKALPIIQRYWPQWPVHVKVGAVGSSTAQALRHHNITVDICPDTEFSSEGLLALAALQTVHGQKIILFRGEGGRDLIATTLRERGAEVSEAISYRRMLPITDKPFDLSRENIDVIVCTSLNSLENLLALVGTRGRQWLLHIPLLVSSQRLAEAARTLGFINPPLIADNATDDALLKALITWAGE